MDQGGQLRGIPGWKPLENRRSHFPAVAVAAMAPRAPALEHLAPCFRRLRPGGRDRRRQDQRAEYRDSD